MVQHNRITLHQTPSPSYLTIVRLRKAWLSPTLLLAVAGLALCGCYSLKNHPLDPSQVGDFTYEATMDIQTTLSLQDSPEGIPGSVDPATEDLSPNVEAYRFNAGDTLLVRIFELLASGTETQTQAVIDESGEISMPVIGRVNVAGLTPSEMENRLKQLLAERQVLQDAQVIVDPLVRRRWTYSLFGAVAAPNLYPLSAPDLRVLEALNIAGGLGENASDVYVFRKEPRSPADTARPAGEPPVIPAGSILGNEIGRKGPKGPKHAAMHNSLGSQRPLLTEMKGQSTPPGDPVDTQPASSTSQPKDEGKQNEAEALQPDAPDSPYIFYNHEWVPTRTTTQSTEESPTTAPIEPPVGVIPNGGESTADWARLAGEEPKQRIIHLSAEKLRNGDPRENIVIRPQDLIRVFAGIPGEYYMMGQIGRPGAYSLTGRQVTLMQAVAAAGGLGPLAWPTRCTIYRRYGDRREMKQVNVDRIFAGRDSDLVLKRDDIVLVGTHPAAPFLAVLRNAFRMTYGFGFVYDRNFADIDSFGSRTNPETVRRFQPRFPGLFN